MKSIVVSVRAICCPWHLCLMPVWKVVRASIWTEAPTGRWLPAISTSHMTKPFRRSRQDVNSRFCRIGDPTRRWFGAVNRGFGMIGIGMRGRVESYVTSWIENGRIQLRWYLKEKDRWRHHIMHQVFVSAMSAGCCIATTLVTSPRCRIGQPSGRQGPMGRPAIKTI